MSNRFHLTLKYIIDHVKCKMKIINNLLDRSISRKASGGSSSSSSSEEDQDVQKGHGFHEGCRCEKCSQRFLEIIFFCLYIHKYIWLSEKKKKECSMNTMLNFKPWSKKSSTSSDNCRKRTEPSRSSKRSSSGRFQNIFKRLALYYWWISVKPPSFTGRNTKRS